MSLLPVLVRKYIGETEKNLHGMLETAGEKRGFHFFDEADAGTANAQK
jgi:ATP-dependent 26S proteasome regulatory subunit